MARAASPSPAPLAAAQHQGLVLTAHGRMVRVQLDDGRTLECTLRGKRHDAVCGDRVSVLVVSDTQAVVEQILPRQSLIYRSDAYKSKQIAANVELLVLVVAVDPPWAPDLLNRGLIAAAAAGVQPLLVLNKCDLNPSAEILQRIALYQDLGYEVLRLSAQQDASPLLARVQGKKSVLVGPSGAGKSTLINHMLPEARARTGEISQALQAGKHTTTHASLYFFPGSTAATDAGWLIDAPGLQEFGLYQLRGEALERYFPEMLPLLGQCRYYNCTHEHEPACAILAAHAAGSIDDSRMQTYWRLRKDLQHVVY